MRMATVVKGLLLLGLATATAGGPGPAAAESSPASPPGAGGPQRSPGGDDQTLEWLREIHHVEKEQVRLVLLPAVVTDRKGRIVEGLTAEDFRVSEDRVPQEIRYFGTESVGSIAVAFLLDVSGSMRQQGKLEEAKESVRVFIDALQPGDLYGLICFADEQVAWITEFTSDRRRFLERLEVQEGYGQTALYDALAVTPGLVADEIDGRKAIVLITDGSDNASRMSTLTAVQVARRVSIPIYVIGFRSLADEILHDMGEERGMPVLERFADETGGALFSVYDPDDLKEAVLRIQRELRTQYVIGYHSSRTLWDGSFRRVTLETTARRYVVRTRSGYYANP